MKNSLLPNQWSKIICTISTTSWESPTGGNLLFMHLGPQSVTRVRPRRAVHAVVRKSSLFGTPKTADCGYADSITCGVWRGRVFGTIIRVKGLGRTSLGMIQRLRWFIELLQNCLCQAIQLHPRRTRGLIRCAISKSKRRRTRA